MYAIDIDHGCQSCPPLSNPSRIEQFAVSFTQRQLSMCSSTILKHESSCMSHALRRLPLQLHGIRATRVCLCVGRKGVENTVYTKWATSFGRDFCSPANPNKMPGQNADASDG